MKKKIKDSDYYPYYAASEDDHAKTFLIAIGVIALMVLIACYI